MDQGERRQGSRARAMGQVRHGAEGVQQAAAEGRQLRGARGRPQR